MFHTVMQRHLWFEILIGSRKKELAKTIEVDTDTADDADTGPEEIGTLTAEEREKVMLDLAPRPTGVGTT